jgi:hypothetical protein
MDLTYLLLLMSGGWIPRGMEEFVACGRTC